MNTLSSNSTSDSEPTRFERLRSTLAAATVLENDAVGEVFLVEDNDDMEGVEEKHSQAEGEEESEEEEVEVEEEDGEEEMEDGDCRTDQEDDRDHGQANGDGTKSSMIGTFAEMDVLDCPVCFEALTVPVFQCENGHIACSSCSTEIGNKCPSCSLPIGYIRCRVIERILNSVNFSCRNLEYGCKETMLHSNREVHELACIFAPCSCPLKNCGFVASSKDLYAHFRGIHLSSAVQFEYERLFKFRLEHKHKSVILQAKTDDTIFILNQATNRIPRAINLIHIGALHSKEEFCYELSIEYGDTTLKLKSVSATMPKWSGSLPLRKYLLVPFDFVRPNGSISVAVCIRRQ